MTLLAEVDPVHRRLSRSATRGILQREFQIFPPKPCQRLACLSVSHLYHLPRTTVCRDIQVLGSVFLVKSHEEENVAKLSMLYVDPKARGLGMGRLVEECVRFARECRYRRITLTKQFRHNEFGIPMTGETWDLELGA